MMASSSVSFNDLPDHVLERIVGLVPLRQRCGSVELVSKKFRDAVTKSVTSVAFYKEDMDGLPDEKMALFLVKFGKTITHLNFDLFRSTSAEETTQWTWRQSVIRISKSCPNLTELDILICNRHRLRDKDLDSIFRECRKLKTLRIDAQYINGHCFQKVPQLTCLEMEMCNRISPLALKLMLTNLRSLRSLYVSQLHLLSDAVVASIVRSFRNLRELYIVSHPETEYPKLTGHGLSAIAKLKLKTLVIEGLGAATDNFLGVISDPASECFASLNSLSLAFCFNVGTHGLKRLARLPGLENLNLDGIAKRDISLGVEKVAQAGLLKRLFLAEKTSLSPEVLLTVLKSSPNLLLLDITNNESILNWVTANTLVEQWASSNRRPLTVLTDDHLTWNVVARPATDELGRDRVKIVHLCLARVPQEEILPMSALSEETPLCLPRGTLMPKIRKGNRYRLVFMQLGPSQKTQIEVFEDQGDNPPSLVSSFATELEAFQQSSTFEAILPPSSAHDIDFGHFGGLATVPEQVGPENSIHAPQPLYPFGSDENNPFASYAPYPIPQGLMQDPNGRDWSLDVLSLLLTTHAFEDGATVGDSVVKEGLLFNKDGSVGVDAPLGAFMSADNNLLQAQQQQERVPFAMFGNNGPWSHQQNQGTENK